MLTKQDTEDIISLFRVVQAAAAVRRRRHQILATDIVVRCHTRHPIRVALVVQDMAPALELDMVLALEPDMIILDIISQMCSWHHLMELQAMGVLQYRHNHIEFQIIDFTPHRQPVQMHAKQNRHPF